jgi:hypothetical protein
LGGRKRRERRRSSPYIAPSEPDPGSRARKKRGFSWNDPAEFAQKANSFFFVACDTGETSPTPEPHTPASQRCLCARMGTGLASGPRVPVRRGEVARARRREKKSGPWGNRRKGEMGRKRSRGPVRLVLFYSFLFHYFFSIFKSNLNSSLNSNFMAHHLHYVCTVKSNKFKDIYIFLYIFISFLFFLFSKPYFQI